MIIKRLLFFILIAIGISSSIFAADSGFVFIPGDNEFLPTGSAHSVQIANLYWKVKKVTFGEWMEFVKNRYSTFNAEKIAQYFYEKDTASQISNDYPIVGITWFEAIKYCNWNSIRNGRKPVYLFNDDVAFKYTPLDDTQIPSVDIDPTANGYRLPTSVEWEYAAKGGKEAILAQWWKRVDILSVGVLYENSKGEIRRVGTLKPNPADLYDIVGLANEWCWDIRTKEALGISSRGRVIRGATTGNKVNTWPDWIIGGRYVPHPGIPDYFSEEMAMDGLARGDVGFRMVSNSP